MQQKHIVIALSSDNNQINAMATVMTSVILNENSFVEFFCLLSKDVSAKNRNKLLECKNIKAACCSVTLIDMDFPNTKIQYSKRRGLIHCITTPALYRLKLPSILCDYDKVIYLDTDVLVRGALSDLWNIDISGYYFAGVPIAWAQINKRNRNKWLKISHILTMDNYVNSGVLLMNLKMMREHDIEKKCISLIGNKNFLELDPADQIILNFVCVNNIAFLPYKFNVTASNKKEPKKMQAFYSPKEIQDSCDNPVIFHWTGANKPWKFYDIFLAHEWFRYYMRSPFGKVPLVRVAKPNVFCKFFNILKKLLK